MVSTSLINPQFPIFTRTSMQNLVCWDFYKLYRNSDCLLLPRINRRMTPLAHILGINRKNQPIWTTFDGRSIR